MTIPSGTETARPFLPTKDFKLSKAFYEALGFTKLLDSDVAIFRVGKSEFILQQYYDEKSAGDYMMQLMVDDLDEWWTHIESLDLPRLFAVTPPKPPKMQSWGLRVAYLVDPSGVLWHVAQRRENTPSDQDKRIESEQRMSTDLDKLQGSWNVTSLEADGQTLPETMFAEARIVINGDRFESLGMGAVYEGIFDVDSTAEPKAFDLIFTKGHAKDHRDRGIYKLDGDSWTICLATRGNERPKTFATSPDTGLALETLERAAAINKRARSKSSRNEEMAGSKSTAPTHDKIVPFGNVTELEGEWAMVSAILNGAPMSQEMVDWCKRITRGNLTKVTAGPQVMVNVSFTLDDKTNPKLIDYVNLSGVNKDKAQSGIYTLDGNSLSVCMSPPGQPRPSDFGSTKGDNRSFTTWRRLN